MQTQIKKATCIPKSDYVQINSQVKNENAIRMIKTAAK